MAGIDPIERQIYMCIASSEDGVKAREIARALRLDASTVNHFLYASPFMKELCWQDGEYVWHAQIPQTRPHWGLAEFSGFYSSVKEFLDMDESRFLALLKLGCENIGRNLNDTRGLFHSFADARTTIRRLFSDLKAFGYPEQLSDAWEIAFELRIKKSKHIRIYADVLLVTKRHAFSFEFKMKDKLEAEEAEQCAKYCQYLDVIFGDGYEIVPVLVLTKAHELFEEATVPHTDASIWVASGDMLYNALDFYLGFIR